MKVTTDFDDTEGNWTSEKRERATKEIRDRCSAQGYAEDVRVHFDAPVAQPHGSGPVVFHYRAWADIPDAPT